MRFSFQQAIILDVALVRPNIKRAVQLGFNHAPQHNHPPNPLPPSLSLPTQQVIPSIFSGIMRESAAPVWVQEPWNNFLFFILASSIGYVFYKLVL